MGSKDRSVVTLCGIVVQHVMCRGKAIATAAAAAVAATFYLMQKPTIFVFS